ncbi:MAG: molybdopterin-dependent oxidoreductase [Syntrophobacteraceae bacterium]
MSLTREDAVTQQFTRSKEVRTLEMEIDRHVVSFPEGATVLRAAELNDIYIPSLCSHKDLSPFGGCRMCVVEIGGMRGYPLACSTIAQEGMKVLTDTAVLRDMRKEYLQLILSEHPSSCLVCSEAEECKQYQFTIRKTGVTTGCRYCPNDGQCELQNVVEKLGVTELSYPAYYRGYEVEHDDPFFDRDYNLCILCGRCVRMCHEVRGSSILAFKYRGAKVQIGPSFGKNHAEAGCEFCGACVSVCPTGALADKSSKWDGKPDGIEVSTCPFCALGCRVDLYHKGGRLSKVYANPDPEINDGQLCVRGRFCLPETTHHHERAKKPMLRHGRYFREVSWTEAQDEVSARLTGLNPEEFLMVVSGDLTNEGLYAAQKFVRSCMGCDSIDSTARLSLPGGLGLWTKLLSLPISIKGFAQADSIIAIGLDSRFYFSIIGVEIRRALQKGAKLVTIDARDSNLARYTDFSLQPMPGKEGLILDSFARIIGKTECDIGETAQDAGVEKEALEKAIEAIASSERLAMVIGPTILGYGAKGELIDAIFKFAERKNTIFVPLYNGSNVRGALELGVFGEILPGIVSSKKNGISLADLIEKRKKPKVLYLVGEAPFFERPDCEYIISQDLYYPPFEIDAFLPASSFAEAEGTLINIEGRVQGLVKIEALPESEIAGFVRPDWQIFSELSQKLGCEDMQYKDAASVLKEIHQNVPGFPEKPDREPRILIHQSHMPTENMDTPITGKGDYLLIAEPGGFRHRNMDLSYVVEGLSELAIEKGFRFNPDDLEKLGIESGNPVTISSTDMEVTSTAKADSDCPSGVIYFNVPTSFGGLAHSKDLEALYRSKANPLKVSVRAAADTNPKEGK